LVKIGQVDPEIICLKGFILKTNIKRNLCKQNI